MLLIFFFIDGEMEDWRLCGLFKVIELMFKFRVDIKLNFVFVFLVRKIGYLKVI